MILLGLILIAAAVVLGVGLMAWSLCRIAAESDRRR